MAQHLSPDVVVYVCGNCIPRGAHLPRQWKHHDAQVVVHDVPCSGKMDAQYLLHSFEGGGRGICVVACPQGECHLAQGNYRAEIRVRTVQGLLGEIGLEPQRAQLVRCSANDPPEQLVARVDEAVAQICALGATPVRT